MPTTIFKQIGKPRQFKLNDPGGNIGGPLWIPHVYNENETGHSSSGTKNGGG